MPRIRIETAVQQSVEQVVAGFDQQLFLKLNPPFPPVRVLRFDGVAVGDEVHLELNFLLFRQKWISVITASSGTDDHFEFVDEGKELPFFLSRWEHRHRIERRSNETVIIDDIEFSSPVGILDWALWPPMWLQFMWRKPVYRKTFESAVQ